MGTRTLTTFVSELGFLLRNRNDADAIDPTRTAGWVNAAYLYMTHPSVHHFREVQEIDNITLATGDNDYSISTINSKTPVAIRWVSHIMATAYSNTAQRRKLSPRSIRWFESRTLTTGQPAVYTIDGSTLFISPVPRSNENNQLLRVGFYREPALLTGAQSTVLTSYYDRPLLKFAHAFAEADLGNRATALVILREATQLLNNAQSESEMEAEDTGHQVEFEISSPMGIS